MVYLWRAVDAEGEVLDVLVQSRLTHSLLLSFLFNDLRKGSHFRE
jgi:transposase-like protein